MNPRSSIIDEVVCWVRRSVTEVVTMLTCSQKIITARSFFSGFIGELLG